MVYSSLLFLAAALVAALFGFGGIVAGTAFVGKILFWIFLGLAVLTGIINVARTRGEATRTRTITRTTTNI
ncbi:DUF1328 family protein [Nannocystaceae bacterium ST9]